MQFDQLRSAWRADIAAPAGAATLDRLTRDVRDADHRYRRQALARRVYGSTALALALATLASLSWLPGGVWPGMRVAIAIWSLSLIACIVGLWRVRRTHPQADAAMTGHLQAGLNAVRSEMRYFRALRWLFWLPFGVGFAFAVSWQAPNGGAPLFLILGTAGLWVWGILYGPRTMLVRLQSHADALKGMLDQARRHIDADGEIQ